MYYDMDVACIPQQTYFSPVNISTFIDISANANFTCLAVKDTPY